jgi:hypothetical protein
MRTPPLPRPLDQYFTPLIVHEAPLSRRQELRLYEWAVRQPHLLVRGRFSRRIHLLALGRSEWASRAFSHAWSCERQAEHDELWSECDARGWQEPTP